MTQRVTLDSYHTCDMSDSTNQIAELAISNLQNVIVDGWFGCFASFNKLYVILCCLTITL
jgi:hypothetical protein